MNELFFRPPLYQATKIDRTMDVSCVLIEKCLAESLTSFPSSVTLIGHTYGRLRPHLDDMPTLSVTRRLHRGRLRPD